MNDDQYVLKVHILIQDTGLTLGTYILVKFL